MRVSEIILNEAPGDSGFDKDVHPDYYEKHPQYTGGAWFTDVHKFHDHLMNPKSYYHKRAVRSPQHPVTGKPDLRFKMPDKRIANDPNFKARYVAAINTPMDSELQNLIAANQKGQKPKLHTSDITKPPTSVASKVDQPAQASPIHPPAPQNVRKMPLHPATKKAWIRQYGKTHNPDGTPKQ